MAPSARSSLSCCSFGSPSARCARASSASTAAMGLGSPSPPLPSRDCSRSSSAPRRARSSSSFCRGARPTSPQAWARRTRAATTSGLHKPCCCSARLAASSSSSSSRSLAQKSPYATSSLDRVRAALALDFPKNCSSTSRARSKVPISCQVSPSRRCARPSATRASATRGPPGPCTASRSRKASDRRRCSRSGSPRVRAQTAWSMSIPAAAPVCRPGTCRHS
mmetsp:Transcript_26535/g.69255  ORF Transcript_26535/g.69255 Transcript_26535/m.69255 type:complete len:222 (-) Transcript_26535:287-952(-)